MPESTSAQPGFVTDCPCIQVQCKLRGNCAECVRVHRKGGSHIPECLQPVFRSLVEELARKVEYRVEENRPKPQPAKP